MTTTSTTSTHIRTQWTASEIGMVGAAAFEIWLDDQAKHKPALSDTALMNKAVRKTLEPHRQRKIAGPATCRAVFEIFWLRRETTVARFNAPIEVVNVHTKEEVMLPPEETIRHTPTKVILAELTNRFSGLLEKVMPMVEPLLALAETKIEKVNGENLVHIGDTRKQPRIVSEKKSKYTVAILGMFKNQFDDLVNRVKSIDSLSMFELVFYDKDKAHLNLAANTDYVIESRHISHKTEAQAIKQMGGKERVFFVTSGQIVQKLMDIRSLIVAADAR